MNWAALRRRIRRALLLPTGKRHRPRSEVKRIRAARNQQWADELGEMLPPRPAEPADAWAPRITRWVKVTFPMPDDTMLLPPGTAAMVLELLASDFTWDVPCVPS